MRRTTTEIALLFLTKQAAGNFVLVEALDMLLSFESWKNTSRILPNTLG